MWLLGEDHTRNVPFNQRSTDRCEQFSSFRWKMILPTHNTRLMPTQRGKHNKIRTSISLNN